MTHQPDMGYQQQPPHGFPPPSAGGPGQVPYPAGPQWSVPPPPPPPRRRHAMLIAILLAVVVVAGGVVTLVLTTSGGNGSLLAGASGSSAAQTPTAGSGAPDPSGSAPSSRPLPPPSPTGRLYENDDPQVGQCADLSRSDRGVSIYEADCADPAATLILESVLPEPQKCPGKGYFGLKSLSKQRMCFTYNFQAGDCVDMQIPRRTACADPTSPAGGKPVVTVAEIRLGQRDGAGCPNPGTFLQAGKDNERGVACLIPGSKQNTSKQNTTSGPSR